MQNFNLQDAKKNALLQIAGKKLGTDPQALRQKLESGQMEDVVSNLDPDARQKITSLLQDKDAMSKLLGSEQVQNLLKNLKANAD